MVRLDDTRGECDRAHSSFICYGSYHFPIPNWEEVERRLTLTRVQFASRAVELGWLLLSIPVLLSNISGAWRESRNQEFGPVLTVLYLVSAAITGLVLKPDFQVMQLAKPK